MNASLSLVVKTIIFGMAILNIANLNKDLSNAGDKIYGPSTRLGREMVRSYIETNENGHPEKIGVLFPESALNDLPKTRQLIEILLPQKINQLPFDHISFGWDPQGHGPEGIFIEPHFNIHFNMLSSVDRLQIVQNDPLSERLPQSCYMPNDFVPARGSVVMVGKQWLDPTSPEFHKAVITNTFLMNSYNYQLASYTPAFTLDHLKTNQTAVMEIPLSEAYPQAGKYYPTQYSIEYDALKKEYSVNLLGFVKR